jgi:hypothetical protein
MKVIGIVGMGNLELKTEIQKGGKFIIYQYVISILIMTFRRNSNIYFVKTDESAVVKGLPYTLLSLLVGWWGIPWGIIYTVQALITNLGGGKDVTAQVLASIGQATPPQNINPS